MQGAGKKTPGDWDLPPRHFELLVIGMILFVLGGISIDFRILTAGCAAIAATIVSFPLSRMGETQRRLAAIIRVAVIPCVVLFWAGQRAYEYCTARHVVPTTEYEESYPPSVEWGIYRREAKLTEPSTFRIAGDKDTPVADSATTFRRMYESFYSAVGAADSRYMLYSKTPGAYQNLVCGAADLIFVFRPSKKQVEDAAAKGREFAITPIGREAFVFFVNRDNPVDSLTVRQVKDIYSGKIRNWKEVGGNDIPVAPYQRYEGSGSQSRMERFMEGEQLMTPATEYRFRHMMGIVKNVDRYHNYHSAIGYSFYLYVDKMLAGGGVKLLQIDGVPPTPATVRDGSYPLVDDVCVVTAGSENPNVAPFIEWMLSPQGQALVEAAGYVPIAPAKRGVAIPEWK